MTRKSTDIGIEISVGSIEPLEKANRPPAKPAAAPAMVKASQRWVAHVDADGVGAHGESRAARSV